MTGLLQHEYDDLLFSMLTFVSCLLTPGRGPKVDLEAFDTTPAPYKSVEPWHPKVEPETGFFLGSNFEWYIGALGGISITSGTRL